MQAAEQVVVLAIGAREERREMRKPDRPSGFRSRRSLERVRILRADAVDQDFVELAGFARAGHRKGQHVPERKAQIVDQHLVPRFADAIRRVERGEQFVEIARRGIETDLERELLDQPAELREVAFHE